MRFKLMVVVLLGSATWTACGSPPAATPATGAAGLRSSGFVNDKECQVERIVLELASGAHVFESGRQPESESDLIAANWIDRDLDGVALADGAIVPVDSETCREGPDNADDFTPECFDAALRLRTAFLLYKLHDGAGPANLAELSSVGLTLDSTLYDLRNSIIVPTETGSCAPIETVESVNAETCAIERKVLEVASEAFLAQFGVLPVDQAELVSAQFLRSEVENFELDTSTGVVEITPVGDLCATAG